ncbi:MAG: PAS domain S-box protein [Nitrospiraceae bacterium]|nr:PAS domain S-box protein [Nitrospiraceae bacterium]
MSDGVTVLGTDFRILYQNQSAISMAGRHTGEYCYAAYERKSGVCESCQMQMSFGDGNVHRAERKVMAGDETRYIEITASPLRDQAGRIVAGVEVVRDLTGRRQSEENFLKTAEILKSLVDASPLAILAVRLDGVVMLWNHAAVRIFGWQEKEVIGNYNPIVPGDKIAEFESLMERVCGGQSITGVRVKRKRKDGQPIDLNLAASPLRDENGNIVGTMALLEDITGTVKMEEQISQSRHDWESTFNELAEMITVHDRDFNITRANRAAKKILGLPETLSSPARCHEYFHGKSCPPRNCPACEAMKTGRPCSSEFYEPHLNRFLEISVVPRFDAAGGLAGFLHVAKDITGRKLAEGKIKSQLEKIRALRKIDTAITGSMDLQITFDIFLDEVLSKLKVDAADILLLKSRTMALEHAASKGFKNENIRQIRLKVGDSCAGQAVLERRNFIFPDISEARCKYLSKRDHQFPQTYLVCREGFKAYFGVPLIVKGRVKGVLEIFHRAVLRPDEEWLEFLDSLAKQLAVAIDNTIMFEELQRSNDELTMAYDSTIEGWSRVLDYRDAETEGHSQRVAEISMKIAESFGIAGEDIVHLRRGALLHDIGKLGVPDSILLKAGPLTSEEWKIMRRHPEIALELLSPVKYLDPAITIPHYHHEKWDGTGYPAGLKGKQIPLPARIFAVADVWDALCSDRPYRKGWPKEKVIRFIRSLSGVHFDPEVVAAFLAIMKSGLK